MLYRFFSWIVKKMFRLNGYELLFDDVYSFIYFLQRSFVHFFEFDDFL